MHSKEQPSKVCGKIMLYGLKGYSLLWEAFKRGAFQAWCIFNCGKNTLVNVADSFTAMMHISIGLEDALPDNTMHLVMIIMLFSNAPVWSRHGSALQPSCYQAQDQTSLSAGRIVRLLVTRGLSGFTWKALHAWRQLLNLTAASCLIPTQLSSQCSLKAGTTTIPRQASQRSGTDQINTAVLNNGQMPYILPSTTSGYE